jgi:antitoxin (DNA-binding transcriptional repressor) of toxin-antitoxin stability system
MPTANVDDVKAHLPEMIAGLNPGEHLVIEQDGEPIATLTRHRWASSQIRRGGPHRICDWSATRTGRPPPPFHLILSVAEGDGEDQVRGGRGAHSSWPVILPTGRARR